MTEWARHNLLLSIRIDHQASTRFLRQGARSFFPGSINATSSLVLCCATRTANSWGRTATPCQLLYGLVATLPSHISQCESPSEAVPRQKLLEFFQCILECSTLGKNLQSYTWSLNRCQGNTYIMSGHISAITQLNVFAKVLSHCQILCRSLSLLSPERLTLWKGTEP